MDLESTVDKLLGEPIQHNHDDLVSLLNTAIYIQGTWDASSNTPNITGTTTTGYTWIVSTSGTTNLGGITTWNVGDWAVKTSSSWARINNAQFVTSINGNTGAITNVTTQGNVFNGAGQLVQLDVDGRLPGLDGRNLTEVPVGKLSNITDAASADNVGTFRYRTSGSFSYVDICMQTGASSYSWVNIKTQMW